MLSPADFTLSELANVESPEMVPVPDDESVATVWENGNEAAAFLFNGRVASGICSKLMTANDDMNAESEDREEEITKLFAKGGVDVQFIGE